MSWLGSLFTGSSPGLSAAEGTAGNISGFGTGLGEGDLSTASGFYNTLLGGNQAAEAQLLAPQIANIQKEGQQQIQTAAQFGNRSGGTNAAAQSNIDTQRANVNNMISQLTGNAASGLAGIGQGALNTGLNASEAQAREAEMQLQNEQNSLFGSALYGGEGIGLGAAGKAAGLRF